MQPYCISMNVGTLCKIYIKAECEDLQNVKTQDGISNVETEKKVSEYVEFLHYKLLVLLQNTWGPHLQ